MQQRRESQSLPRVGIVRLNNCSLILMTACFLVGLVLVLSLPTVSVCAAEENGGSMRSPQARSAQLKRVEQLLETAEVQIDRKMFRAATNTLDRCKQVDMLLPADMASKLESYSEQAYEGLEAQQKVDNSLGHIQELIQQGELAQVEHFVDQAKQLSRYLTESTRQQVKNWSETIDHRQAELKDTMKSLFKQSVSAFESGDLDQAEIGFLDVKKSGVDLGFFDTGDVRGVDDYLELITQQRSSGGSARSTAAETPVDDHDAEGEALDSAMAAEDLLLEDDDLGEMPEDAEGDQDVSDRDEAMAALADDDEAEMADESIMATASDETVAQESRDSQPAAKKKEFSLLSLFGGDKTKLSDEQKEELARLIDKGDLAMDNEQYAFAREYYQQALSIDQENETARKGLSAAEYHLMQADEEPVNEQATILDKLVARERVQRQYLESRVVTMREKVESYLAESMFEEARAEVSQIIALLDRSKRLLGPETYSQLSDEARGLLNRIDTAEEQARQASLEQRIREAEQEELERQRMAEAARQEKIDELFERALAFRDAREYSLAVSTLEQLLELDENHPQATLLMEHMQDMLLVEEQMDIQRRSDREEIKLYTDAQEASIPWSDLTTFPDDWREITERRLTTDKRREYVGSVKKQQVLARLDEVMIPMNYVEEEFQNIINQFRGYGFNIIPMWNDIEFIAGINPDDLVTIQLDQVSVGKALERVLDYVSGGRADRLGYTVGDEGIITINAVSILGEAYNYFVKVYYIADLVEPRSDAEGGTTGSGRSGGSNRSSGSRSSGISYPRDPSGRDSDYSYITQPRDRDARGRARIMNEEDRLETMDDYMYTQAIGGGTRGGGRGGSGRSGRGGSSSGDGDVYERIDSIIELIQYTIYPDSWEETTTTGEGRGMIDVYGVDSLIVFQKQEVHDEIDMLLKKLRKTRGAQVSIEARMLVINSNYLEDIGLDVDFYLNLSNAGFDRTGTVDPQTGRQVLNPRADGGNKWTPITSTQDHYSGARPGATGVPGSLGGGAIPSAFSLAGSFLDNIQVDFLMRATQARNNSKSLTAPHVTIFNGESASIEFVTEQNYVSSIEDGDPQIDTVESGITLDVTPTISADKRYVYLHVYVSQDSVQEIDSFSYQTSAGELTDADTVLQGTTSSVQQPVVNINTVTTHVAVPDGGTLLLGGQKLVGETETEVGVPALSKIPILNRLFTNRSTVKDEQILLILIKPKIILHAEEEELRFGDLSLRPDLP